MKICANVFQEENSVLKSQLEVKKIPDNLDYVKMLQKEIIKLNLQLEVKQKQLESSGDVNAFNNLQEECFGLKSQLQNQSEKFDALANKLKEENSKLATQLKARQKLFTDVTKVRTNVLQEENEDLQSQLEITKKQLAEVKGQGNM